MIYFCNRNDMHIFLFLYIFMNMLSFLVENTFTVACNDAIQLCVPIIKTTISTFPLLVCGGVNYLFGPYTAPT